MRALTISMLLAARAATAAGPAACDIGDYAEYKDRAGTRNGPITLALEYCKDEQMIALGQKVKKLATDSGDNRSYATAQADSDACKAEQRKIETAMRSAKVKRAFFDYMAAGCEGRMPQ